MSNCWKCWKVKHQVQHHLQHQVLRALPDTVQYWKSLGQEGRNCSMFNGILPGELDELSEFRVEISQ